MLFVEGGTSWQNGKKVLKIGWKKLVFSTVGYVFFLPRMNVEDVRTVIT